LLLVGGAGNHQHFKQAVLTQRIGFAGFVGGARLRVGAPGRFIA